MIHPEQDTLKGSFGLGILAAVLSTPCTAPFMGAAAAWAATQPPASTLAVFVSIGIGMAFPYFLLSVSPHLVSKMPKTGPASVLVKQVMGLFMLAAAAYFVGIGVEVLLSSLLIRQVRFTGGRLCASYFVQAAGQRGALGRSPLARS